MPAWTSRDDGIHIAVRVTPRGGRDALTAGTEEHFAARLSAPPVDGAANDEVVRFVAKALRVGRGSVTLVAGQTSRVKRLRIIGKVVALKAALRALLH